jgi:hypothetical protein
MAQENARLDLRLRAPYTFALAGVEQLIRNARIGS